MAQYAAGLAAEAAYALGLWTPRVPARLAGPAAAFVSANAGYWKAGGASRPGILVEGHLSQYGPNYLLRTAVAAKALQEKTGLDIEVVFSGFGCQWALARLIYESFRIHRFLYLDRLFAGSKIPHELEARRFAQRTAGSLREPTDILDINFDGIRVGDLIYDDILKLTGRSTIQRIDADVVASIAKSRAFYLRYLSLFRRNRYDYYVSTHTMYSEYGLLCRVALAQGVRVIETTDIQMSSFDSIAADRLPTYHQGIRDSIDRALAGPGLDAAALRRDAAAALERRLSSEVKQLDAQKAYRGRLYGRAELAAALGIPGDARIAFVLAHIFSDAPHLSSRILHADYYRWLQSTLRACAGAGGVHWVVKPHPSAPVYREEGMVEAMVREAGAANVHLCPADLNTRSLGRCADAIVTVLGTAGLEFSCLGVPAVLAGTPFYAGFGFTIEPATPSEYDAALQSLAGVAPLTETQKNRALEIYALWDRQFDWDNPVITPDVLASVWGSGQPRNLEQAYERISANLRASDPRNLKLWRFAQSVAGPA